MNKTKFIRPPLESLACGHPECEFYGISGQDNLIVRKVYGKNRIRYLRCRVCQSEFSERKGTALWNSKIDEERAISIAEHLEEGCKFKGMARLVKVDPSTVRRLNRALGKHAQAFHDIHAQDLEVDSLQADEWYGFVRNKRTPAWEAEIIDPASKFVISHKQGRRDSELIRGLLEDGASRLKDRHDLVLFTDG